MGLKIWLGDGLVDQQDAAISVFDHSFLYGDGVFEGIRVYGGNIFEHRAHLVRLYESAKVICLPVPMEMDEMAAAVEKTVAGLPHVQGDGHLRRIVAGSQEYNVGLEAHRILPRHARQHGSGS